MSEFRRRLMMAVKDEDNPYKGFIFNAAITSGGEVGTIGTAPQGCCVCPIIPVDSGINIKWYHGLPSNMVSSQRALTIKNSSMTQINYWASRITNGESYRAGNLNSGSAYIQATFYTAELDNCYIYDNTNGVYLFKGRNVI